MQHKRDRIEGFSDDDVGILYEGEIEEVDTFDFTGYDPQDVMDTSVKIAAANVVRKKEGRPLIALPPELHQKINEYARKGMHKGRGRRRPRDSSITKGFKQSVLETTADYALKRKAERLGEAHRLLAEADNATSIALRDKLKRQAEEQGIRATGHNSAEDKAIEDALEWSRQRYTCHLSVDAIRRAMSEWR